MFYIQTHTHTCTHVQSNTLLAPDAPRKKKWKKKKEHIAPNNGKIFVLTQEWEIRIFKINGRHILASFKPIKKGFLQV